MSYFEELLYEDERVIRVIRSHPIAFFWSIFFSILFICLAAFFIIPLFAMGRIGFSVFGLLVVIGLFLGFRALVMIRHNSFIITDRRLIDWSQRGLFDQEISETLLEDIYDVSHRIKGVLRTMANVGSVRVLSREEGLSFVLYGVKNPQEVRDYINGIRYELG